MRTTAFAIGVAALLVMGGCRHEAKTSSASPSGTTTAAASQTATNTDPEELGRIGAAIKKQPKDADRILSEHGMTQASFERAIRSVSSDPAASRRYRDAYKKAGA